PAGDPFAIGAEGHAIDNARVPFEGAGLLTGLRIPDLERPVLAPADDPFAIGAEGHAQDRSAHDQSLLIAVEKAAEIGMLPTAQAPAAGVQQIAGMAYFVILPFALGKADLTTIDKSLRPFALRLRLCFLSQGPLFVFLSLSGMFGGLGRVCVRSPG